MKIVQINATCGIGSTGKICLGISQILTEQNMENHILYSSKSNGYDLGISCSNDQYIKLQAFKSRLLGNYGFNSVIATKNIINELEKIQPDIVHLHNIHGHDCHLEKLFTYFKKKKTKLFWTFHDCWAFTAYCPYFTMANCDKWKQQCFDCPKKHEYTWIFDRSKALYEKKKELFSDLDLTIITPSQWLGDLVKQSFLGHYPVKVVNNGIDLNIFRPTVGTFRKKYGIDENKKIILGVAFEWDQRKGLDVFLDLSNRLERECYQIVLVGTNDEIDRRLPENIISIHRTNDQSELAEIYTASDIFVNPTREENFPTVNIESLACGTPVLTFRTGGSPEIIDETCGASVACDDINALEKELIRICSLKPSMVQACLKRAKNFDKDVKFKEYLGLYEDL